MGRHIRQVVIVVGVNKAQQHITFQVRHPENAIAVIGIAVTTSLSKSVIRATPKSKIAGSFSLSRPDKGDVVYTDDVQVDNGQPNDKTSINSGGLTDANTFMRGGTRQSFFETELCIRDAVWDGYYEDQYVPVTYTVKSPPIYKVTLYIIYQLIPEP